jgi:hypothetical protein
VRFNIIVTPILTKQSNKIVPGFKQCGIYILAGFEKQVSMRSGKIFVIL